MEVVIKPIFVKELKRLSPEIQTAVRKVLRSLANSPSLEKAGVDYKRMEGQKKGESYYRIRVGQWRIGIEYLTPQVVVITILSRGNIYKHFPRDSTLVKI